MCHILCFFIFLRVLYFLPSVPEGEVDWNQVKGEVYHVSGWVGFSALISGRVRGVGR